MPKAENVLDSYKWCGISHDFDSQGEVVAGHIVPRSVGIAYMDYLLHPWLGREAERSRKLPDGTQKA
jgi:hypothetical protein